MSSFKQKLRYLLNDSTVYPITTNMDQKLDRIILRTYHKIKKDNRPQSIMINYKNDSCKLNKSKLCNKKFSEKNSYSINSLRGISPKTAVSIVQTFSILKNNNNSRNHNNLYFYTCLSKYLKEPSKINQRIKRDIQYLSSENSNYNDSKNKNRFTSTFNNSNYERKRNLSHKANCNLQKMNLKTFGHLINNKNNFEDYKANIKEDNNFKTIFNGFKKERKNKKFNYSRNNFKKYFCRTDKLFNNKN
jgi:hypothetical protein